MKKNATGLFFVKSGEKKYPNPRIIAIGEELSRLGGVALMQEAYYEIIKPFGFHGPTLKWVWNGIGG